MDVAGQACKTPFMTDSERLQDRKTRAQTWFESLRDRIHAAFEKLEDEAPTDLYPGDPGRFVALTAAELVALPWLLDTDHLTENGRAVSNLLDAGYVIGRMS